MPTQDAPLSPVKMEMVNAEIPQAGLISSSEASEKSEAEVDDLYCLSGDKPFFSVILSKSHVESPHQLNIPAYIVRIFPRAVVPMVLTYRGKEWNMPYIGSARWPRFEYSNWRAFVRDNNLECDDSCVFEVTESSNEITRLRVIILRHIHNFPPELAELVASRGLTPEAPIELD